MVQPEDNFEYYAYILLYVDDCLAIHHDAEEALQQIDKYFLMKAGLIGDPDLYLGDKNHTSLGFTGLVWLVVLSSLVTKFVLKLF